MTLSRLMVGSLILGLALFFSLQTSRLSEPPIVLAVAASLRPVAESIVADFTIHTGRKVEIQSAGSEQLLRQLDQHRCDVFLPADAEYLELAQAQNLVTSPRRIARMHAVAVAGRPVNWQELTRPGLRIAVAQPETAAIGRKLQQHLIHAGRWQAFAPQVTAAPDNVSGSVLAVRLGAVDVAIVWDAVARDNSELICSELPELAGIAAEVAIAPCVASSDPSAACALVEFFATEGQISLTRAGFAPP